MLITLFTLNRLYRHLLVVNVLDLVHVNGIRDCLKHCPPVRALCDRDCTITMRFLQTLLETLDAYLKLLHISVPLLNIL